MTERRTGVPRRLSYNRKPDLSILDRRVKSTRRKYHHARRNLNRVRLAFNLSMLGLVISWVWFVMEVSK